MAGGDKSPGPATTFRQHLDRIERGDLAEAMGNYAEDAILEADPTGDQGHPDAGVFRGRAIARWIDNWFSSFDSYRFDVEEAIESGDGAFMTIRHTARGEASGVDVEIRVYHAVTMRDGLIVRHTFSSEAREAVMQAAGIASR